MFLTWLENLWWWLWKLLGWDRPDPPNQITQFNGEIDMANIRLTWALPSTRESGGPLSVADIERVDVMMSADGGANFAPLGSVLPVDPQETVIVDVEFGTYVFRAVVIDTGGTPSQAADTTVEVADTSAPSPVVNFGGVVE